MMWHSIEKTSTIKSVLDFEKQALTKNGFILNAVPPRYHTPYFAISGVVDTQQDIMPTSGLKQWM